METAAGTSQIAASLLKSVERAEGHTTPYPHWFLNGCLPGAVADEIAELPLSTQDLGGVSGKRELHNDSRNYFDSANMARFPVCKAFNEAFQSAPVVEAIQRAFGARLAGSFLRVEYAQDTDGFWLGPHSDIGVKVFTMLIYLSKDPTHHDLGTDIYDAEQRHFGRSPFTPNGALIFVPSEISFHGFERRPIVGVRKSVIINYVTNEWRAREQLPYPNAPVA